MNVESSYQVSTYNITIGWQDNTQQFYAELVDTHTETDKKPDRQCLKSPTDCLRMLDWLSETIEELTGVVEFYPPHHDIVRLMDAPRIQSQSIDVEDFLADPGRFMDVTGNIYPDGRPATAEPFWQDNEALPTHEESVLSFEAFIELIDGDRVR